MNFYETLSLNFTKKGETMKSLQKLSGALAILIFTFALIRFVNAQAPAESMKTFFDSDVPGIRIQVNATAETQPNGNITAVLSLKAETDVHIEHFNLSIFGFTNGIDKILMANITDNNFSLNNGPKVYNCPSFKVPERVWDVTYGEITLAYNATYTVGSGILIMIPYENLTIGFTMTHVENTYLKEVEEQRQNLNNTLEQLKEVFWESFQMNLTADNLADLNKTYSALKGSASELGSTRQALTVLAITTVFFVATTVYLVVRKPKQYW